MRINIFSYSKESLHEEVVARVVNTPPPIVDGKAFIEKEYVLYAKIANIAILDKAESFCLQEQWEVKVPKMFDNFTSGRIRVRKTTSGDKINYVLATKIKVSEGNKEIEIMASEDMFNQFKLIATTGMNKKRYIFPIENSILKWEVDVFITPDGDTSEWVKIDLEVLEPIPKLPQLPPGFTNVISNQGSNQTDEEKRKIQDLYNTVFLRKNEHLDSQT